MLQIPFYRPHSEPWVISMSQLNLIIGPARLQEYDEEQEREAEREQKKRLLNALEDKWKVVKLQTVMLITECKVTGLPAFRRKKTMQSVFLIQSAREQKGESYWYSVTASVVTRIVENIEVTFLPISCLFMSNSILSFKYKSQLCDIFLCCSSRFKVCT